MDQLARLHVTLKHLEYRNAFVKQKITRISSGLLSLKIMRIVYLLDTTIFTQPCSFNHMGLHGKKEGSDYCNKKTKENNTRIALYPSLVLYIFTCFGSAYIIKDQLSICISNKHQQ